ncbi:MAG: hypothetical protein ACK2T0_08165 [Anaerolineales bacterium]|jgi:hypothetical protein
MNRGTSTAVTVESAGTPSEKYVWQPKPINVWFGMQPRTPLERRLLEELRTRLMRHGCICVDDPHQATSLGRVPHLAIGIGEGLEQEISPLEIYGKLPKPRATVFVLTIVKELPETGLFDLAREQLVKKSCHMGALFETNGAASGFSRVLWGSMAGNYRMLDGGAPEILDDLVLRILIHAGAEKVNLPERNEPGVGLTWDAWSRSPVHADIADAARRLGEAGIIDDEVYLHHYGSADQVRMVLRFLERGAMGEGMRSQLDPELRVMGITATGGGKVNISPDPQLGHVVPIGKLTWNGYVESVPVDSPIKYAAPSIETHENGLIYLAGALINAGRIHTYDGFLQFLREHFDSHTTIDVLPAGMTPRVTAIDHFHRQPRQGTIKDPRRVEVVYPDRERFPDIDFPCGVREAGLQLLSAVFRSKTFTGGGSFDKLVVVVLPGHGSVALYNGPRRELTDLLVNGMEMEEVRRV